MPCPLSAIFSVDRITLWSENDPRNITQSSPRRRTLTQSITQEDVYGADLATNVLQDGGRRCRRCGSRGRARRRARREPARPADREPDLSPSTDDQRRQLCRAGENTVRHWCPAGRDVLAARLRRFLAAH